MRTSETIDQIIPAMLKAQSAIQAVVKDKTGKVQTKTGGSYEYKYSDLSSVIDHVKPHLNANGIVFSQSAGGDSTGVMVETRLFHVSGQWIATTIYLPVAQTTPQGYGSAITYGKRYGLQSLTGLPSEDDDGKKGSETSPPSGNPFGGPKPITATQEAHDTFEALPEDAQAVVREWAMETIALVNEGKVKEASAFLAEKCQTTEDKLAVWSQLPSNVRTKLKAKPAMAEQA